MGRTCKSSRGSIYPGTHQGFSEHSLGLHAGTILFTILDVMSLFTEATVFWGKRHQVYVQVSSGQTDGEGVW